MIFDEFCSNDLTLTFSKTISAMSKRVSMVLVTLCLNLEDENYLLVLLEMKLRRGL